MTLGITGATGQLGRIVVKKLKEKTSDIVALVRSPMKAADLGVTARLADYDKPDTLDTALTGVDTLLLISANEIGKRAEQHKNVVAAAKKAGVKRIVYTSILHANSTPMSLAQEHVATEAAIISSGIPYTILRNGWYTENYTNSIQGALAGGAFIGSAGNGKISSATRADFAEAAVAVLTGEGHTNRIYELAGDGSYSLTELAAEISRQTGKNIPYKNLSVADYAAALAKFGIPEPIAKAIAGWDADAAKGALYDNGRQLSRLIGRATTPLSAAVAEKLIYQ
jgi:NAD(P)H dehydrogenase (quinone)